MDTSKPVKKWVIFFVCFVIILILVGAGFGSYAAYEIFMAPDRSDDTQVEFKVEKGKGVNEIAAQLEQKGLIRSSFWFETYIWLKKEGSSLQAGKYLLSRSFNTPEVAALITGGKVVRNEAQITIPEGFNLKQAETRLTEQLPVAAGISDLKIADFKLQYKFLGDVPENYNLEGFLFPDTYRFDKEIKKEDIVKKFLDNFNRKFTPELREELEDQNKSLYDVMIMASIVQMEAQNDEEMPLLAGVFYNRLRMGMLLQSDATVNYATGKSDRQASSEDLKTASPYNTYLVKGLPKGPICNPGLAAIKAAIFPATTDYLYFLHPKNSPAVFAKTAEEHNRNKAKYLK